MPHIFSSCSFFFPSTQFKVGDRSPTNKRKNHNERVGVRAGNRKERERQICSLLL